MSEAKQIYHVPVLLNESVDGMNIQPGGIYVDATFGGGGHSKEILAGWIAPRIYIVLTKMKMPRKIL